MLLNKYKILYIIFIFTIFYAFNYIFNSYVYFDQLILGYSNIQTDDILLFSIEHLYSICEHPLSYYDIIMLEQFSKIVDNPQLDFSIAFFEERYQILEHDITVGFSTKYGDLVDTSNKELASMYDSEFNEFYSELKKMMYSIL